MTADILLKYLSVCSSTASKDRHTGFLASLVLVPLTFLVTETSEICETIQMMFLCCCSLTNKKQICIILKTCGSYYKVLTSTSCQCSIYTLAVSSLILLLMLYFHILVPVQHNLCQHFTKQLSTVRVRTYLSEHSWLDPAFSSAPIVPLKFCSASSSWICSELHLLLSQWLVTSAQKESDITGDDSPLPSLYITRIEWYKMGSQCVRDMKEPSKIHFT